jgi:hypothetical protein
MTGCTSRFLGLLLLIGVSLLSKPAMAGTSFEFLFSASNVSDDNQLFLNLSVGNYGYPRTVVEPCLPRLRYVETDLPVVLFLARSSGRPVDFIVDLRSQGLSWGVIFSKCNVHYDVLFAGISRDPGPPYGKAWGHWKKNKRAARLSDDDIVGLVHCQVAHRVSGVSVYDVAHARGQGKSVAVMVADKKGRPEHISKAKGAGKKDDNQGGNAQAKSGKQGKGKK